MIMRSKRGSKKGQKTTQSVSALGVTAPKKSPDVSSAVSDSADPIDTTDAELDNPLGETLADSQAVEAAQSDIEEKESKEMETHEEQEQERVNENEDDAAPSDEHPGFLPLANILPPLPQKGAFDVNEIRVSLQKRYCQTSTEVFVLTLLPPHHLRSAPSTFSHELTAHTGKRHDCILCFNPSVRDSFDNSAPFTQRFEFVSIAFMCRCDGSRCRRSLALSSNSKAQGFYWRPLRALA